MSRLSVFGAALALGWWIPCANAVDTYDGNRLTIPAMMVGNVLYSDVVVTVGRIISGSTRAPSNVLPAASGLTSGPADSYDPATGLLAIPLVQYAGKTYFNVVVTIGDLVSIGAVDGADRYANSRLTVNQVEANGQAYQAVTLSVTPASIVSVGGGMPRAAMDEYDGAAGRLLMPAVQAGSTVYTNVTISVTPRNIAPPVISEVTTPGHLVGLTLSPQGIPYFLDTTNSAVGFLTAPGQPVEFPGLGPTPAPVQGVFNYQAGFGGPAFGPDGNVYFPYFNADAQSHVTNAIGRINPVTGEFRQFPIPTANAGPFALVLGPDGALWFTEYSVGQIGRLTMDGTFSEFALPAGVNADPTEIVVGPDGALWFPESGIGRIGRIPTTATPGNPQVTEFPMSSPGCISNGIASGPLHSLWYVGCAGLGNFTIDQVSMAGEQTLYLPPPGFTLKDPRYLTVGADGALWFTDQNANFIDRLVPTGRGTGIWTQYAYPLVHPGCCGNAGADAIVAAPDGSLWWVEFNTGNVGHLVP